MIEQILATQPDLVIQLYAPKGAPGVRTDLPLLSCESLSKMSGWLYLHDFIASPQSAMRDHFLTDAAAFRHNLCPPDHRTLTLLGHLITQLADAETSLPGYRIHGSSQLGHPAAHLLDVLPFHVPLACFFEKPFPSTLESISENVSANPNEQYDQGFSV
ncbi:unnamed protein product [Protopolystoma xenopodis]|uniref:Uncharacterized protein n=1 Tax=Protopolystoma xenopodis TaxID=117903 RepID=A0A448XSI1_9PLAT|nr:unnamed protein product [Protopolystoma xenopodis]